MPSRRRHRSKAATAATTPPAVSAARVLQSRSESESLARELLAADRERPVVVVTVPQGRDESFIDAERVSREVAELADVVVLATQDASWGLSRRLPEGCQVYGGAGRVYPVGAAWTEAPQHAPLSFAYSEADTDQATSKIVSDTLAIVGRERGHEPHDTSFERTTGTVSQLIRPSRALVRLDDGAVASVMAELTVPGVPIDGLLEVGQHVAGRHDPVDRLLDLRGEIVSPEVALAGLTRGDVVPVRVAEVADDDVVVLLHPAVPRTVPRDRVTSNPADSLRSLFSVGEVVAARVAWIEDGLPQLRLDDVDDDDLVVAAPALLPWGPPWLALPTEPGGNGQAGWTGPVEVPTGRAGDEPPDLEAASDPAGAPDEDEAADRVPRAATRALSLTVDSLRARLRMENARLQASELERDQVTLRVRELDAELQRTREELQSMRTRLRNQVQQLNKEREARKAERRAARGVRSADEVQDSGPAFLHPVDQWRHEVYLAWVDRIPASDKAERPLPADWHVGPEFLDSLETLEGVSREKVADVVVEVLTGLAKDLPGRDLHRLRSGDAGNTPAVVRADGAVCWRAALQRETASARRLHYWELPGGTIELSRVVPHDDMTP